ncbi:MAG: hypothetical protein K5777_07155 [Nitrosopumilus sp.]|nr:hypothetical protein [Nitrosopumilus sp.]
MNKNYLSLFVIMGVLITGTIPVQQTAFADSDELKVEIKIKNGISEIEVEFEDDEYEFQLATSDIDEILEVTSLRTGIPVDLLEEAMKLEVKDDHDDQDDDHDDREDRETDDFETDTLEKKLRASTLDDSSEVKIELEFVTDTTDSELLIDEILENFLVSQEEAEDFLKIQAEDDDELEEKFKVEIETDDGMSKVEVELRYVLDSTDRDEIIASIVEQSQLDRDLLVDAIETEDVSDDSFDGIIDDSDSLFDDSDSDGITDDSELAELREENQLLREEIKDLKEQLANLNHVLMEQIRVIMDTLSALKS